VTLPLFESDGSLAVQTSAAARERMASATLPGGSESQHFILVDAEGLEMTPEPLVRTSYGDVRPVRVKSSGAPLRTFIYPRGDGDPSGEAVRDSFRRTPTGWTSDLGRVEGTLYIGRTAAGGFGTSIRVGLKDLPEVTFSEACGFLLEIEGGALVRAEADRAVRLRVGTRTILLDAYSPKALREEKSR
jgi:hypothetical protein